MDGMEDSDNDMTTGTALVVPLLTRPTEPTESPKRAAKKRSGRWLIARVDGGSGHDSRSSDGAAEARRPIGSEATPEKVQVLKTLSFRGHRYIRRSYRLS